MWTSKRCARQVEKFEGEVTKLTSKQPEMLGYVKSMNSRSDIAGNGLAEQSEQSNRHDPYPLEPRRQ